MSSTTSPWRVHEDGESESDICSCCGSRTRSVWGNVSDAQEIRAVYLARWTDHPKHPPLVLLISAGNWADDKAPEKRWAVGLECRADRGYQESRLIDASTTPWGDQPYLGFKLQRDQVIDTPLAEYVFAMADAIFASDERLSSFLSAQAAGAS